MGSLCSAQKQTKKKQQSSKDIEKLIIDLEQRAKDNDSEILRLQNKIKELVSVRNITEAQIQDRKLTQLELNKKDLAEQRMILDYSLQQQKEIERQQEFISAQAEAQAKIMDIQKQNEGKMIDAQLKQAQIEHQKHMDKVDQSNLNKITQGKQNQPSYLENVMAFQSQPQQQFQSLPQAQQIQQQVNQPPYIYQAQSMVN